MQREKRAPVSELLAAMFGTVLMLLAGGAAYPCRGGGVYQVEARWVTPGEWGVGSSDITRIVCSKLGSWTLDVGEVYRLGFVEVWVYRRPHRPRRRAHAGPVAQEAGAGGGES